ICVVFNAEITELHEPASPLRTANTTALVVTQRYIRLAKSIAPQSEWQPCLLRRNAAIHSSRVFAICNPLAARAKVLKRDVRPDSLQNSPATNDPHCSRRNISERSSLVR